MLESPTLGSERSRFQRVQQQGCRRTASAISIPCDSLSGKRLEFRGADDRVPPGLARHEIGCLFIVQHTLPDPEDILRWGDLVVWAVL